MNLPETIKAVQREVGVEPDGDPGVLTWSAIAKALKVPIVVFTEGTPRVPSLLDELATIAESQLGTQEDDKHQNRGSAILKYQQATNLEGQGWPWCAAFVDYCIQELLRRHSDARLSRPQTAAAYGLIDWAQAQHCQVFHPKQSELEPQRGDLVVYTFSHCGIVAEIKSGDFFHAIEGNSNIDGGRDGYQVVRHLRDISSVNRFIRLTPLLAS